MTDAPLVVLHDWSPFSGYRFCVNCGQHIVGAPPECVPTTTEPGCDE